MTFKELQQFIKSHKIREDVRLESDSGWECDATDMDGLYYNENQNLIVFTQGNEVEKEDREYQAIDGWVYYEHLKRKYLKPYNSHPKDKKEKGVWTLKAMYNVFDSRWGTLSKVDSYGWCNVEYCLTKDSIPKVYEYFNKKGGIRFIAILSGVTALCPSALFGWNTYFVTVNKEPIGSAYNTFVFVSSIVDEETEIALFKELQGIADSVDGCQFFFKGLGFQL